MRDMVDAEIIIPKNRGNKDPTPKPSSTMEEMIKTFYQLFIICLHSDESCDVFFAAFAKPGSVSMILIQPCCITGVVTCTGRNEQALKEDVMENLH